MKLRYVVVFEQTPNNYCAYVPDVPGCISTGKTWYNMLAMIQEALTGHIEYMVEDGDPVPEEKMSIEDAMREYLEPLTEEVLASYSKYGEPAPALSVTFQTVEIDVRITNGERDGLTSRAMLSLAQATADDA